MILSFGENMKKGSVKNFLSSFADFVSTVITAFLVLFVIVLVLLRAFGVSIFTVESGSMAPKYPVNSVVLVKEEQLNNIKKGDVITYVLNDDGMLVTHRVVSADYEKAQFVTKGDANKTEDPLPVSYKNVVGKVFMGVPYLGAPVRFISDDKNKPIVIAVLVFLGVLSIGWDIAEKIMRKKRNCDE